MADGTLKVGTITTSTGSGSITIPSGVTLKNNTPAFMAYQSAGSTTISSNTETKVQFNTEVFDTDNTFDNSTNYRWTPGVVGKYWMSAQVLCVAGTDNLTEAEFYIKKNGSTKTKSSFNFTNNRASVASPIISITDEVNLTTDYYEIYVAINDSSGSPNYGGDSTSFRTYFTGYRIGA
jgi:hypothetical protein